MLDLTGLGLPGALVFHGDLGLVSDGDVVLGTDVVARFDDRPDLLAGFRVQVGSKVFDGSLVGQVDRLSRHSSTE